MPERASPQVDIAHDPGRQHRSTVSGIVIGCLLLVAIAMFAFAAALYPFETSGSSPRLDAGLVDRPLGNVDFGPASNVTLTIASRVERVVVENEDASPSDAKATAAPGAPTRHWVQLGALTKAATATRYWDTLKARFPDLLAEQPHRIFAPEETRSRLYHLRIGPMDTVLAHDLCTSLLNKGGDCFCVPATAFGQGSAGQADTHAD